MDTSDELQRLPVSVLTTDSRNHWTCLHKLNNIKASCHWLNSFTLAIFRTCEINNILHNEILTTGFNNSINMEGILFYISKEL